MKHRYKVQLTESYYHIVADDDHDAAQQGAELAAKFNQYLHDVSLDDPETDTDDLDGDSLLWL